MAGSSRGEGRRLHLSSKFSEMASVMIPKKNGSSGVSAAGRGVRAGSNDASPVDLR